MARPGRCFVPGCALHVVNRGNDRRIIFPEAVDYGSFLALLREGRERFPVQIYAYDLVKNHFHLVLAAEHLGALSAYMHFVQRSHACDLRAIAQTRGQGHVFQRRYWSAVLEGSGRLLNALRYVEANALRASLVDKAEDWEWGSLWERVTGERDLLSQLPFHLPDGWPAIVNTPQHALDLKLVRTALRPGRPAGPVDLRNPKK
ncbi:MAG: transposase [Vicinamibacterales bacterium]